MCEVWQSRNVSVWQRMNPDFPLSFWNFLQSSVCRKDENPPGLVDSFSNMKKEIVYSGGGISLLTRRQAGEAVVGALEGEVEGGCYPVGKYKESWSHIAKIMRDALQLSDRKLRLIPKFMYTTGGKRLKKVQRRNGYESGFDMVKYTDIHYLNKYLPEDATADLLGITEDDYEAEIQNIVIYSMKLLSHKKKAI